MVVLTTTTAVFLARYAACWRSVSTGFVCAGRGSVGGSARPPVEAQVGRHRGSTLTDFAGINGGFGHR
jgi:hypothetical protein|tara:strand:- start:433 stop:636 length:204 start_codon:yes stop_codon:yes gene_type:complete